MEQYRVLCYGDSNTYGYDPRSCLGGRYSKSIRWTALLESDGWRIFNEGQNGRCIPQRDWEIAAVVQKICQTKPNIVMIMLGSNDLLQQPELDAVACAKRMEHVLTALFQQPLPAFQTLLVAPPPMALGSWVEDNRLLGQSRRMADCYGNLARQMEIRFANAGTWGVGLAFDGVHFSEQGHRIFYKEISNVLRAMI